MADFKIIDQFEPEAHIPHPSLMDSVWHQMRNVGMMWGAVVQGQQALMSYDRALRQGHGYHDAAERALSVYAGPRSS
jgi:hypothetical protein